MNFNPMKGTEKKALESVGKSLMEEFDKLIKTTNALIEKVNALVESHQRICDYLDDKIIEVVDKNADIVNTEVGGINETGSNNTTE